MVDVLPSSIASTVLTHANTKIIDGIYHVPVYCANCGTLGLWVPELALEQVGGEFAFYLCPKCDQWGGIAGLMKVPDEVFAEKFLEVQHDEFGGAITPEQVALELQDANSTLSLLKRERAKGLP